MTELRRPLTEMQAVVVERIGRGMSYAQAARSLGISKSTARVHVHHVARLLPNPDHIAPLKLVYQWAVERRLFAKHADDSPHAQLPYSHSFTPGSST